MQAFLGSVPLSLNPVALCDSEGASRERVELGLTRGLRRLGPEDPGSALEVPSPRSVGRHGLRAVVTSPGLWTSRQFAHSVASGHGHSPHLGFGDPLTAMITLTQPHQHCDSCLGRHRSPKVDRSSPLEIRVWWESRQEGI